MDGSSLVSATVVDRLGAKKPYIIHVSISASFSGRRIALRADNNFSDDDDDDRLAIYIE